MSLLLLLRNHGDGGAGNNCPALVAVDPGTLTIVAVLCPAYPHAFFPGQTYPSYTGGNCAAPFISSIDAGSLSLSVANGGSLTLTVTDAGSLTLTPVTPCSN